ncbi:MAG: hypothetical protein AAB655_01030, partial [Patescibacteria group bacterium]
MSKRKPDNFSLIVILSLVVFSVFVWTEIIRGAPTGLTRAFFLDVGQGDSELVIFPGNVKILTDAGPDRSVVGSIEKVLGRNDRYVDVAVISHPQLDHFNGFNYLLENYRFGIFVFNGRPASSSKWGAFYKKVRDKKIPLLTLGAGDRILYGSNSVDIVSPNNLYLQSAELNDTGLVEMIKTPFFRMLLTG